MTTEQANPEDSERDEQLEADKRAFREFLDSFPPFGQTDHVIEGANPWAAIIQPYSRRN